MGTADTQNIETLLKVEPLYLLHGYHTKRFKYESYNVGFTLAQRQNNLRIFLNATVVFNLVG